MNPLHAEFLAHDRISGLRQEAKAGAASVRAGLEPAPSSIRFQSVPRRLVGHLRIALRLVHA